MKVSLASVASVVVMGGSALGQSFGLVGQFSLPSGTAAWDVGPDGRVWAMVGSSIVRQDAVNGGSFSPVGSVPSGTVSSFGASFLRVNSAGVLAIGDNNFNASARVHFVEATALSTSGPTATSSVLVGNFAARWNGSDVYITGAGSDFVPFVARVTYTDAATPPTATRVISGVGGASGGI
nr:hypothetical protein [Phycisphaerales bacterium]